MVVGASDSAEELRCVDFRFVSFFYRLAPICNLPSQCPVVLLLIPSLLVLLLLPFLRTCGLLHN